MLVLFVLIFGGFSIASVNSYLLDTKIMSDPAFTQAVIDKAEKITKRKHGVERISYKIHFNFTVDNQTIQGTETFSETKGGQALEKGYLDIAYNKSSPGNYKLKSTLNESNSIGELLWTLLKLAGLSVILAPVAGFILAYKLGWTKKKENKTAIETA